MELAAELETLRQRALTGACGPLAGRQSGRMEVDGRACLLLAGSNYLDLAGDARVIAAAQLLGLAISKTSAVHPPADQRNLELLLARPPVLFLGELAHGASRLAGLDLAALLTSAGSV